MMDPTLRELSSNYEQGYITAHEYRHRFIVRLVELDQMNGDDKDAIALATAIGDFDDG